MKISMAFQKNLQKSRIVLSFQHLFVEKNGPKGPEVPTTFRRCKKKPRLRSPTTKALLPCKYLGTLGGNPQ